MSNPKLEGSNLIDCIPNPGRCPNDCKPCYYNEGFYRDINEPLMPTLEEVGDKIVRVNSGGDSSNGYKVVIAKCRQYPKKFYNTSQPHAINNFDAPVVLTANPANTGWFYAVTNVSNIMYVRARVATWNMQTVDNIVWYYTDKHIPVVLTFLRFPLWYVEEFNNVYDIGHDHCYETKQSELSDNTYKIIKPKYRSMILKRYQGSQFVFQCGSDESSLCKDCNNCVNLYERHMARCSGFSLPATNKEWYL